MKEKDANKPKRIPLVYKSQVKVDLTQGKFVLALSQCHEGITGRGKAERVGL